MPGFPRESRPDRWVRASRSIAEGWSKGYSGVRSILFASSHHRACIFRSRPQFLLDPDLARLGHFLHSTFLRTSGKVA
jgi:hypothetical protein